MMEIEIEIPDIKKHREETRKTVSKRWIKAESLKEKLKRIKHPHEISNLIRVMPSYIVPNKEDLREAAGIKPGEPVAMIAGAGGGIARSLANEHPVEFTDASPGYVDMAKKYNIPARVELADEFKPTNKNPAIISVEPYPILKDRSSFMLSLLNLMSHGKSLVLIENAEKDETPIADAISKLKKVLEGEYNTKVAINERTVRDDTPELKEVKSKFDIPNEHRFVFSRLDLSPESRERAKIDLELIRALQNSRVSSIDDIARILKKEKKSVEESLRRVERLRSVMEDGGIGARGHFIRRRLRA